MRATVIGAVNPNIEMVATEIGQAARNDNYYDDDIEEENHFPFSFRIARPFFSHFDVIHTMIDEHDQD